MSLYATDGSFNLSVVTGSVYTGRYAADGSLNVVLTDNSVITGSNHPCGAMWVVLNNSGPSGLYAPCGAYYVQESPYSYGGLKVTAVSGSLHPTPPSGHATFYIYGF